MIKCYYKTLLLLIFCLFQLTNTFAQLFPEKKYPQNYFIWPVGARIALAANFGELRPNHYHMGLDCKTDQKENLPVYAAADGYIAKINIDPTGFGQAIYINHPNGLTTLYAHLNEFYPELETYIKQQQYKLKQWRVILEIPANLFPVKKGELIARSGNTGGSQGPHLHFEIRDTKTDNVLNPLLFGFPIEDNIAPEIIRLAVYDRRMSTYEQTPKIYPLKKINGIYQPIGGKIKVYSNKVSFAITAYDRYTGSTNQNGIFRGEIFEDEKALTAFEMDSISYDETRCVNAHIDYKTRAMGGQFLQLLSQLPGYANGIYKSAWGQDGVIKLNDVGSHKIKIIVSDANNNSSLLIFDLIKDSVVSDRKEIAKGELFKPGNINVFENETLSFYLPENSIFDSFHFKLIETPSITGRKIYKIQEDYVPVYQYFPIKIKDNFSISDTGHIVMKQVNNGKEKYKKAIYENGWYKSMFRDFGTFQLVLDNIPPIVTPTGGFRDGITVSKSNRIAFAVTDNTKEIGQFSGFIDDTWILFSNDKGRVFVYTFDQFCPPGEHTLRIVVKDIAGNTTEKNYRFRR